MTYTYKSRSHYDKIIRQSMWDLNKVCIKHTQLTHRRIYNWLIREGDILEGDIYYLRNPIDAYEILFNVSWERIGRCYNPPLHKWNQSEFLDDVAQATEPGKEAMWRRLDLDDPEAMAEHQASINEEIAY